MTGHLVSAGQPGEQRKARVASLVAGSRRNRARSADCMLHAALCILALLALPAAQMPAGAAEGEPAATAEAAAPAGEFDLSSEGGTQFSLIAVNADAKALLAALSKESGWDVRMVPEAPRKVTVTLTREPFDRTLAAVAAAAGCQVSRVFIVGPKTEGSELPDPFKLPLDMPVVSLKLADPVDAAAAVAAVQRSSGAVIEAQEGLTGKAKITANRTPLPEVLDTLCRQANAVWALAYRLKPGSTAPAMGWPPGAGNPAAAQGDGGAAAGASLVNPAWTASTPEQRRELARREIAGLLRATPAERQLRIGRIAGQIDRLGTGLARLSKRDARRIAQLVRERAEAYLQEVRQVPQEQQPEFEPAVRALAMALQVVSRWTGPPPGAPGEPGAPGMPGEPPLPGAPG